MKSITMTLMTFFTFCALGSVQSFKYDVKHTFTLYPKGSGFFSEFKNTRLSKGLLNIDLKVKGQSETHLVNLGLKDFKKSSSLLKANIEKNKKVVSVSLDQSKLRLRLDSPSRLNKAMRTYVLSNLNNTLTSIDQDLSVGAFKTAIKSESLKCSPNRNYLICELRSVVEGETQQKGNKFNELIGHLFDLKKEMISSKSTNYDIEGYREFLTKAENLLDKSLKSTSKEDGLKRNKLLMVKDLLINERIDSYEYTAIRSKSIVDFVDLVLSKMNSFNA